MSTRVMVEVPSVAFKGPHDTDAKFFRQVANRIDAGYGRELGGSNVTVAVVRLLRAAADALGDQPAPQPSTPTALGFQVQCDCGQQALVATQPSGDWVCPRCAANMRGGFGDVDIAAAEPEDEWPVCKVCG